VFFGVVAPGTPPERIKVLNEAFVRAGWRAKVKETFASQGLESAPDHSPAYLGQFINKGNRSLGQGGPGLGRAAGLNTMQGKVGAGGHPVLDLSRILGGPLCGQILGDHGADVLKVEPPQGDDTRAWGPPFKDGVASYYFGLNRNKRIQFLDLSAPEGRSACAS
jgi:hypothetical protein